MSGLPKGWVPTTISELAGTSGIFVDGDWVESKDQDPNGNIRLLQLADIGDGAFVDKSDRWINDDAFTRLRCTELATGDVLIARMPDPLGRACLMPALEQRCVTVVDVAALRVDPLLANNRWAMHTINAPQLRAEIDAQASGTTRKRISRGNLGNLQVPLPPEAEQKRIANKLDTVLTRVNAVNTRLARVASMLKRFRQSVLAAATVGRLTDDWRRNEAPAWSELCFSDVVLESSTGLVRSATDQAPMRDGLTPYLKMNSIGEMWGYQCNDLPGVHCSTEEFNRYELKNGDWLFNTRNSVELVGKSCVWNGPAGVVFNNNLLRVRFKAAINPNWVEIYFRSPIGRNLLNAVKSATTSVAAIYQRSLMELPLKLPPEREQTEIVRRVETLLAFADRIEGRLQTAQTGAERLAPALLAKAFRGELVPQDPNDEPASELLRRSQADRPASKSTQGRRAAA
ncbi:restriction endonuclease subunit S [Rubrivivax sp. RP6-9]|uniref:restriction endonuclease subunit S n=1 Tax=Rubrivivax sp. RP6-9 TaxID=3415750 RepID=UPI003CC5DD8C